MSSQTVAAKPHASTSVAPEPGDESAPLPRSGESASLPRSGESLPLPRITFYRMFPDIRPPERADRSAAGSLPTRAFRYCEPVRTGSAFGYYVFPPMNFSVMWDGHGISWTYEGAEGWMPLKAAQYPYFAGHFDERAPDEIRGFSPPFLVALQEPGILQIWPGIIARTPPGWSSLVRACANIPRTNAYDLYEGVIETDHWFGPLLTNMRLTKTDVPIEFTPDMPLFQVQPLPREALDETALNGFALVRDIESMRPEDWDSYYDTVVRPNVMDNRPRGMYATAARKRLKDEERDTRE
jgi:hypothetical protein